jgi:hypothetical protein
VAITPLTIITRALEHLTVAEPGQTIGSEDSDLCLRALISMLGSWQLSPQHIIGLQELTHTPTAGTQSFTIGPAGSIVARQPLRIEPSSFYRNNSVDLPLGVKSLDDYNAKASKTATGPPEFVALVRGYDTATVYLYPAADGTSQLRLWVQRDVVSSFDALALNTTLTLPAGYQNDIEWCLADEVGPDFAVPDRVLARAAHKASIARARLKRSNTRVPTLRMPASVGPRGGAFNINEG